MKLKLLNTFFLLLIIVSVQVFGQTQFVKHLNNPIFGGTSETWDAYAIVNSSVVYDGEKYNMYYTAKPKAFAKNPYDMNIGYAYSNDGMNWEKYDSEPILKFKEKWEKYGFYDVMVLFANSVWHMWYTCPTDINLSNTYLGYATSDDGITWSKRAEKLNLSKSKSGWDSGGIIPLSIIQYDEIFKLYYWGYEGDDPGDKKNHAIGVAVSEDGINWEKEISYNPIITAGDSNNLDRYIWNLSVIYNDSNKDQPYQMWYIGSNKVDENDHVFHAASKNGKVWIKDDESVLDNKNDNWAKFGYQDIEIAKVGNSYKMWVNGIAGNASSGIVLGYAEDFTNTIHCSCLGCDVKYNEGKAPNDFESWICNPSSEQIYVWARIECSQGKEIQKHRMSKSANGECFNISRKVICPKEKFYTFSSYVTSDILGNDVLFDSKNFFVEKFTTVSEPEIEVVEIVKHPHKGYQGRLKVTNGSQLSDIMDMKVKVTAQNNTIDLVVPEMISFENVESGSSKLSESYIYWDINEGFDDILELDFDILSEEVLYWSTEIQQFVGVTDVVSSTIPNEYLLEQNYPNPFNPSTTIKYSIPNVETHGHASVQLKVYDILGREIATLVDEKQKPGLYEVEFDASHLTGGVYFYRLETNTFLHTKKMIILR